MDVRLEAIKFNHDPDSATRDAFNIRRNETEFVERPEWRRGVSIRPVDSPTAYAIRETRGKTITIKAQFSSTEAAGKTLQVRAVEARAQRRQAFGLGLFDFLLRAILSDRLAPFGNVLGQVKEREIDFNSEGKTGFEEFELQNVRLWSRGVSVSTTEWRWQFRANSGDQWTDFALTRHRVYVVLEIPKCPWQQEPFAETNTQLPWAEALEVACDWAASATDVDEAATLVTRAVNDLGLHGVTYDGLSSYSCPNFNCTQFLDLVRGGLGMGKIVNCSDCASAVSSFANLVGCDLRQLELGPDAFHTNQIKLIGATQASPLFEFFGHEVAWYGNVTDQGRVFDACLQLDGDDRPEATPFVALLPKNIPFGSAHEKNYRFRLSATLVFLKPDTLGCRKIGYSVFGDCKPPDDARLEFLKIRHDYASWKDLAPGKQGSLGYDQFLEHELLSQWVLRLPVQRPKFVGAVNAVQSLWCSVADKEAILRLDVVEWKTWQEAREFMLRELGEFRLPQIERLTYPTIGDVSFASDGSVLFARAQFVFLVRSVGRTLIPLRQTALELATLYGTGPGNFYDGNDFES